MSVGYLVDAFDMLNVRDLDLIAQARALCTELVVGVLTDDEVTAVLGRPPVVPLEERLALVGHVRGVTAALAHPDPAAVPVPADVVLAAADRPVRPGPDDAAVVWLTPRRESASPALRQAVRPTEGEAVA